MEQPGQGFAVALATAGARQEAARPAVSPALRCWVLRGSLVSYHLTLVIPPQVLTRLGRSRHQRLALHRPAEGLGHRGIEVGDEALDPLLEMLLGPEVYL